MTIAWNDGASIRTGLVRFAPVVIAFITLLAGADKASAAFPGENGRIAFARDPLLSGERVVTVAPDGSGEQTLVGGGGRAPAWSPDGTKVAFLRTNIHVVNADGTGLFEVGPEVGGVSTGDSSGLTGVDQPAWSPDGTRIAYDKLFTICGGHECVQYSQGIWVINVDGSGETRLSDAGENPAWSPDGAKIAFDTSSIYSVFGFPGDLFVMNADGSGQVNLTNSTADESEPNWSPDGAKVAFTRSDHYLAPREIDVIGPGGGPRQRLTEGPANDSSPAWSPDGTKIVFRSERDGGGLLTMNADGTDVARLTGPGPRDVDPDWQPLVGPQRSGFRNASQFCKAQRDFLGESAFAAKYGGGANAHGRCVTQNH